MTIPILLLAAGASTRLEGKPKQLLPYKDKSLIRYMAEMALSLQTGPVVVVLGAQHERMTAELADLNLLTPFNADWPEGMASSLRVGLNALADQSFDAFLVLLTDQPHVTADLLRQLIHTRQQTGRGIVASRYGEPGNLGVPALFDSRYQDAFMRLSGDVGARKLIQQHADDCEGVPFPLGAIDLDTWQDVRNWQASSQSQQ
ncbi:nucleotidyltransferase family protein [Spirosoma taeanense]|uniref:Nucleotidyltransferase family protein n=1 Tax=Spirosoma taeanense TaxID=2735870 RepID=A0A6M5YDN6_9BACT|nr:nucleotidyltransferase family protein [Spirosoma taeanense]QJW92125.1 nucleotidyltransferase family protein [Spirosoma taeanense]